MTFTNFIIYTIVLFFCINLYQKIQIKNISNDYMLKINDWLQQIHFYHAIYYELKKIKKIFQWKFILIPNFKLKNLLRHLEDISNILDNLQKEKPITDIEKMMLLTYDQLVDFLKTKYGEVPGNYFLDFSFTETNHDIKRSNEGLEIHHIMEYEQRGLSNPEYAKNFTFDYQKGKNLVYCDLLEHFLLHLKICDYSKNPLHPDVGKKGAFIILQRLQKIFLNHNKKNNNMKKYQRQLEKQIYRSRNDFWKLRRLFYSLKIYL